MTFVLVHSPLSLDAWHLSLCGDPVPVAEAMLGLLESAD